MSNTSPGPEWIVLEKLARGSSSADDRVELDELLRLDSLSWGELFEQSLRHQLLPALAHSVVTSDVRFDVPFLIAWHLESELELNRFRIDVFRREAARVSRALTAAGIGFVATKGICFESTLYEGQGTRHIKDVDFMIVGLAAAALQGAPAVTQDVDLWFRDRGDPGLKEALSKVGGTYVPPSQSNPLLLVGASVELFDVVTTMHGLESFEREARHAAEIRVGKVKVKVLPLDRIIASKEAVGRPKDLAIIPALRDAAATLRSRGKQNS